MIRGETVLSGAKGHAQDRKVSPFQVMRSAAEWYIGTTYKEEYGEVPNTRETEYFATEEIALRYLKHFVETGELVGKREGW